MGERPSPPLEASYGRTSVGGTAKAEPATGGPLADPRFKTMQSLFPGQLIEWHERETVSGDDADATEEDPPDTLNLETDES